MKTPFLIRVLRALVALCIVLSATIFFQYRSAGNERLALAESSRASQELQGRIDLLQSDVAQKQTEFTAHQERLREALTPEERRYAATLPVVEKIKASHAVNPPRSRRPPPPSGPNGGIIFPELMGDPEYSAAYLVTQRTMHASREKSKFDKLGLSEDLRQRVVILLAESDLMELDFRQLTDTGGLKGYSGKTYSSLKELRDGVDNEIRTLLGDTVYDNYRSMSASDTSYLFTGLASRLSYSSTPLEPAAVKQLEGLLMEFSGAPPYKTFYTEAFVERARSILSPEQLQAFHQLRAEREASEKRARLPKSSELPRNRTAPKPVK